MSEYRYFEVTLSEEQIDFIRVATSRFLSQEQDNEQRVIDGELRDDMLIAFNDANYDLTREVTGPRSGPRMDDLRAMLNRAEELTEIAGISPL